MLRELHIHQLAVIEDVRIELSGGLNCFTGQTGAGKSLILGAFEILLGLKSASAEMLRPGATEARVSGVFELRDADIARQASQLLDQTLSPGDELLITRKIFATGRSSLSVNGQVATAAMVRAVSELLVDIHGQHDQQYLLKAANQVLILDAFAKSTQLRETCTALHRQLSDLARKRRDLAASRTLRQQQLELYEYQAGEIDEADITPGELQELRQRHVLLGNIQRIKRDASQVHQAIDDSEDAVMHRLQSASHLLEDLARLDPQLDPLAQQLATVTLTLQDTAFELSRYASRLDLDPEEMAQVEERLNVLNRLVSKYAAGGMPGQDPLEGVLAYRQQLGQQIHELRSQDEDLASIDQQAAKLTIELREAGAELSRKRQAGAKKLRPLVEEQLKDLGMAEANFEVAFIPGHALAAGGEDGVGATSEAGDNGLETMEMMVRTNPGQPMRPLRKIASGGEMSRIMLALKAILAQSDRVSVLVFDEIDANIGGRMGTIIGQKLRTLADTSGHQVLCITHLPQIAAFASHHLRIAKTVEGKGKDRQTRTAVTPLHGQQRIEELAQMLAGNDVSTTTRRQIKEMLAMAG